MERLASTVTGSSDPTILILATDGDPTGSNNCNNLTYARDENGDLISPEDWSVQAVQRAHAAGIRTLLAHVDRFLPVHNLASLADLAQALRKPALNPSTLLH